MDEEESASIFQSIYQEFKDGNPIFIPIGLLIVVLLGSWWVWQTTHNPVVETPTPMFRHPSAVSPLMLLATQAASAAHQPQATVTPPVVKATPTPTPTRTSSDLDNRFFAAVYRCDDLGIW